MDLHPWRAVFCESLTSESLANMNSSLGNGQDSALQAAAEAAAQAAQLHMSSFKNFDGASLSQDGYLTALLVQGA
jgi:hypothetical protein